MSSIDTSSEGGGHKKGPGVKRPKTFYRVDTDTHGGSGFSADHIFRFTATMTPTTLDLNMPKDIKNPEEQTEAKETGVLSIMLGKGNQVLL
ncbi:MAG: hypothetical protein IPQ06_07070 [Chitinophagaceae bacterium]|nr:hypothetical protein [Chitinophagaceae bacterium]